MKYWRTMLIAAALGVCGLAVWANDTIRCDGPKPAAKPAADDPANDDVFPPQPAEPSETEPPTRVLQLAAMPSTPTLPVAPPVVPPIHEPAIAPPPPLPISEPPPLPKGALELPPASPTVVALPPTAPAIVELPPALPPAPALELPPAPAIEIAANPPTTRPAPPPPPPAIVPSTNPPVAARPASKVNPVGGYRLYVRMGGNLGPRFEVRDGDTLLLKVYCDRIDLQGMQEGSNVLPGLTATGNVRVSGSGLNGTCDQLTIASIKGEVTLKGNVRLTCYRGNASSDVISDMMRFQLRGAHEGPSKIGSAISGPGVVPVSN